MSRLHGAMGPWRGAVKLAWVVLFLYGAATARAPLEACVFKF